LLRLDASPFNYWDCCAARGRIDVISADTARDLENNFFAVAVDTALLVFLLVSAGISETKTNKFRWLHANLYYLGRNGMDEIRMVGFPS
jgi:hypothetical protein